MFQIEISEGLYRVISITRYPDIELNNVNSIEICNLIV